jgi:hypothetical protein
MLPLTESSGPGNFPPGQRLFAAGKTQRLSKPNPGSLLIIPRYKAKIALEKAGGENS